MVPRPAVGIWPLGLRHRPDCSGGVFAPDRIRRTFGGPCSMNTPDFSGVQSGSSTTAPLVVPYEKIPYTLSPIERENWLYAYGNRPSVRTYLETGQPPWGIIERAAVLPGQDGNYLLFIPTLGGVADPANL